MSEAGVDIKNECYGCVFCRTGREKAVARALRERFPGLAVTAISQVKHKSINGCKTTEEKILFPGYVFFRTDDSLKIWEGFSHVQNVIRLLRDSSGEWILTGQNERFAQWVFEHGGVAGMSKAYKVGDHVKIQSGPLKDFEGQILKIDRRSRNGQVEFRFDGRVWKAWLAFELVE